MPEREEEALTGGQPARRDLTWRSLLLGLGLTVFLAWWVQHTEVLLMKRGATTFFPPLSGFLALVLLALANAPLRRWAPRWALTSGELVVVFTMGVVTVLTSSMGFAQKAVAILAGTHYMATPGNQWHEFVIPHGPLGPTVGTHSQRGIMFALTISISTVTGRANSGGMNSPRRSMARLAAA